MELFASYLSYRVEACQAQDHRAAMKLEAFHYVLGSIHLWKCCLGEVNITVKMKSILLHGSRDRTTRQKKNKRQNIFKCLLQIWLFALTLSRLSDYKINTTIHMIIVFLLNPTQSFIADVNLF